MAAAARIVELAPLEAHVCKATEAEVEVYAEWLGVDTELERDLFPIARAGLFAALPKDWIPCQVAGTEDLFYFNQKTGESIWDHPLDFLHKQLVREARAKRRCYTVSLALLEGGVESRIQGTSLAGEILVTQAAAPDESFGDVEDKLRLAIVADDDRVLCFVLPNAKLIGFSCRSKPVQDVFKQG